MSVGLLDNYLEDDWGDNALTGRTNTKRGFYEHPNNLTQAGEYLKAFYRPEWEQIASDSGRVATAVNERVEFQDTSSGADSSVATSSEATIGSWSAEIGWPGSFSDGSSAFTPIAEEAEPTFDRAENCYYLAFGKPSTPQFDLYKNVGGSATVLANSTWDSSPVSFEFTRGSYGNMEYFESGASEGTATDTDITESEVMMLGTRANTVTYFDNLVVQ